jgi:hypothetical protein
MTASHSTSTSKPKHPSPLSIRLTEAERAVLKRKAGNKPLATYAREQLIGEALSRRKTVKKSPELDKVLLAQILGVLGKSELAKALCLLAVAAESGSAILDDETDAQVKEACADIRDIRLILIRALGLRSSPCAKASGD